MGRIFQSKPQGTAIPLKVNPAISPEEKSELIKYKDEIEKLKNQNNSLLTTTQQALSQYKVKIGELTTEKQIIAEQSEKDLESEKTKINDLLQKNKNIAYRAEKAINYFREKINELVDKNKELTKQKQDEIEKLQTKSKELEQVYNTQINELIEAKQQLEIKVAELTAETQALNVQNQVFQKRINEGQEHLEALEGQERKKLDEKDAQLAKLQKEYEIKIGEIIGKSQETFQAYQLRVDKLQGENQRLQGENQRLQGENQKLAYEINRPQPQMWQPAPTPIIREPEPVTTQQPQIIPLGTMSAQPFMPSINAPIASPAQQIPTPATYIPTTPSPAPTTWRQQPNNPQLPIMGERRFEISDNLKKRLNPIKNPSEVPPVQVLKSTFGVTNPNTFTNPLIQQTQPTFIPPQQPMQQMAPPTRQQNPTVLQTPQVVIQTTQQPNNPPPQTPPQADALGSDVQVLISQLGQLKNEAETSQIGKEEFGKRLSAALRTVKYLSDTQTATPASPEQKTTPSPVDAHKIAMLTEKNEELVQELEKMKQNLGSLEQQAEMSEKEKEDFRAKLAESIKALSRVSTKKETTSKNTDQVVRMETEIVEPNEPTIKIVRNKVVKGSTPPLTNTPNVINGVIKDAKGFIIPETIIVVKDIEGSSVRALKTNKLGQFVISTPLPNGTYTVEFEKEGYKFDIIQIDVAGELLPPLEIRSR